MKRERATEDVKHNFLKTTLFRILIRLIRCQLLKDQEEFFHQSRQIIPSLNHIVTEGDKKRFILIILFFW